MNRTVIQHNIAHVREALPLLYAAKGETPPSPDFIDSFNQRLKALFAAAEIFRYDSIERAEKILASSHFKSVVEREVDRVTQRRPEIIGGDYLALRRETELQYFGFPISEVKGRPIYGACSNGDDETVGSYGHGEVRFVFKNSFRRVTTVTNGDTMNALTSGGLSVYGDDIRQKYLAAVPLESPSIEIFGLWLARPDFNLSQALTCKTLDELRYSFGVSFFEAQIHGEVNVSDIERIELKAGKILSKEAQEWAERLNITIWIRSG